MKSGNRYGPCIAPKWFQGVVLLGFRVDFAFTKEPSRAAGEDRFAQIPIFHFTFR